jgi:hypothetical protein
MSQSVSDRVAKCAQVTLQHEISGSSRLHQALKAVIADNFEGTPAFYNPVNKLGPDNMKNKKLIGVAEVSTCFVCSRAHNDPDILPSLMGEPMVRFFHMSWATRRRPTSRFF